MLEVEKQSNDIKLSVVILYNNQEKTEEALSYLEKQLLRDDMEIIAVDNRQQRFSSAASGLNYGASLAKGDAVLFMHQDILLIDPQAAQTCCDYISEHPDAIVGVAGVCMDDGRVHSDIYRTQEKKKMRYSTNGKPAAVYSLDECMFAMKKSLWEKLRFDEVACDGWHLYAVDICYQNLLCGGSNVLLPLKIWHKSVPSESFLLDYDRALIKIIRKYNGKVNRLEAPCSSLKCSLPAYYMHCLKRKIYHFRLKHNLLDFKR